ncbi:MAG: hypothetical protein ACW960_12025, partial [Candidatus Thorarchaeota archaeon]
MILVEKQELLGGRLNDLHHLFPKMESAKEIVDKLVAEVQNEKRINVMLNSKVVSRDGSYGNYDIEVENIETGEKEVHRIGSIVVAVGT